jgi:hypothetical protein
MGEKHDIWVFPVLVSTNHPFLRDLTGCSIINHPAESSYWLPPFEETPIPRLPARATDGPSFSEQLSLPLFEVWVLRKHWGCGHKNGSSIYCSNLYTVVYI